MNQQELPLKLADFHTAHLPCEIACDSYSRKVLVSAVSRDVVVLRRVGYEPPELTGWWVIRPIDITDVRPIVDGGMLRDALEVPGTKLPTKLPFRASSMTDVAQRVCHFFPIVIFKYTNEKEDDAAAGKILSIDDGIMCVREISTDYQWLPEPLRVKIEDVRWFFFGNEYEQLLELKGSVEDLKAMLAAIRKGFGV